MKPLRSLLFVPGHRGPWVEKALRAGPDAVILDLEDAVPTGLKAEARQTVRASIQDLRETAADVSVYVRVNPLESGMTGEDLEVVLVPGLTGLVLPKSYSERDIVQLEALVDHFERRNGVVSQSVEFIASLETAEAYQRCEAIAVASPRVVTLFAGTASDGDLARSVGYEFTADGLETLYLRSRAILAARSAGLPFPLTGLWQDLNDEEGALRFAQVSRQMGFRGQVVIHPSHVPIVNRVYGPTKKDIAFYSGMIAAFEAAVSQGAAAILYEGTHIDYAHVQTAREYLKFAESFVDPATAKT